MTAEEMTDAYTANTGAICPILVSDAGELINIGNEGYMGLTSGIYGNVNVDQIYRKEHVASRKLSHVGSASDNDEDTKKVVFGDKVKATRW